MEGSRVVKMARKSAAVMLGAIAFVGTLDASADAKPALSHQQAVQAAGDRLNSRVERSGDVLSFGIDGCVRRTRVVFTCRGSLTKAGGSRTVDCGFTYRVSRRSVKITATLIRNRCEARPGDGPGIEIPGPRDPSNPFQEGPGPKYCPGNKAAGKWDARTDIVGRTYAEAVPIVAEHGCEIRIVRIDGQNQVITMDLRYDRMNVEVEGPDQLITRILGVS